jgi:hypothetical protein
VNSFSANAADPLAAYRLNNATGAPTYSYGGSPVSRPGSEPSQTFSYGSGVSTSNDTRLSGASSVKASIVFVRSPDTVDTAATARSTAGTSLNLTALLPSGTRLAARLESAATTAVKTPVLASIEYNYERDGMIIVPAGTKVIGDVQQASTEGYLSIRFHTLQLPNGRDEAIEATAVALDHKPLKGAVSGKNTAKKVLSRTLSGVGTVAAYVIGAGGAGLGRTITGETLLRDRIASASPVRRKEVLPPDAQLSLF